MAKILGDGQRQRTQAFAELQSYYRFDDKFGPPAKGNDKGEVEGLVDYSRRHFIVPLPVAGLCELERIDRERRTMERRIRLARFPVTKSLDTFDFMAMPSLNKSLVLELAHCEWIDKRENVIALGPSGVGKTHTALALGLAACQKGHSVAFTTAAALVHELMEVRDEKRLHALQKQVTNVKLLIVDELGYVPFTAIVTSGPVSSVRSG